MDVKFEWESQEYVYSSNRVDMPTAFVIKEKTGWGLRTWDREVGDINPLAIQALFFAIRRQNGQNPLFEECAPSYPLDFYEKYLAAFVEAKEQDNKLKAEGDPGKADGVESPPISTPTSES